MSGNGNEYGGAGWNSDKQPDQQQYDPFGNPLPRNATYPTGSFPHAHPQGGVPGFAAPQPPNMFMGGFPQQAPIPHGFNPSQQMGGHQSHFSQGMPPQYGQHRALPPNSSNQRAINPPWPSMQGNIHGQQPSNPAIQNTLQPFTGALPNSLPQEAFPQPSSVSTSAINQSHTYGNSAFSMQQAVSAPVFVPNSSGLADPASTFDDDYIHPRTGRPTRPLLPHEKSLLRQYYRLKYPLAPNATDREIQMWHIRLRSTELTEWDKFVDDNESKSQAAERAEAIEEYQAWISDIKQSMRDEIRSDARGNVYGRLGRAPGSRNKPKIAPPNGTGVKKATSREGGSVLKGSESASQLDSDDAEEDDDDDDADNDDSDTIVVEVPKKGMSKGRGGAATPKKSTRARKAKISGKKCVAEASEVEEEVVVDDDGMDVLGLDDPDDVDGSGTDMEFTEDN